MCFQAVSGGSGAKPKLPPVTPHGDGHGKGKQCDQGLRAGGGGQPCLWWSQGCSIGCAECATDIMGPKGQAGGLPGSPHADKIGFRKRFCNATHNSAGGKFASQSAVAMLVMYESICFDRSLVITAHVPMINS